MHSNQISIQHQERHGEDEAKTSFAKIKKLEESKDLRKQYARSLVSWIGAKAYQKEQSAEITPQEEEDQEPSSPGRGIDHKLWLDGCIIIAKSWNQLALYQTQHQSSRIDHCYQ